MKRNRKVKILATLGPASGEEAVIRKLFEAGADVFRINMSHADHDLMRTLVKRIRNVERNWAALSAFSPTFRARSCALASSRTVRSISFPARPSPSTTMKRLATNIASIFRIRKFLKLLNRGIAC